jgi:hypothetical protein
MSKKGNFTALQALRPQGAGISRDIQYWNEDGFKRRAEDRLAEQQEFDRAKAKKKEDAAKFEKHFKISDTINKVGSRSLDEKVINFISQNDKKYLDLTTVLSNSEVGSPEYTKALSHKMKLDRSVESLKQTIDNEGEKYKYALSEREKGNIEDNEASRAYFNNFKGDGFINADFTLDDNYDLITRWGDADGDGQQDYQSAASIAKGELYTKLDRSFNMDAQAELLGAKIKNDTTQTDQSYVRHLKEMPNDTEVDYLVKNTLFDKEGGLTDKAKSFMFKKNIPNTEEGIKQILKDFKEAVMVYAPSTKDTKTKRDAPQRPSGGGQPDKANSPINPITPTEKIFGKVAYDLIKGKKDANVNVNALDFTKREINLPTATTADGENISNAKVEYVTLLPNGDLAVVVNYEENKGSNYTSPRGESWESISGSSEVDPNGNISDTVTDPARIKELNLIISSRRTGTTNKRTTVFLQDGDKESFYANNGGLSDDSFLKKKEKKEDNNSTTKSGKIR